MDTMDTKVEDGIIWIRFQHSSPIFLKSTSMIKGIMDWITTVPYRGLVQEALYEKVPGGAVGICLGKLLNFCFFTQ